MNALPGNHFRNWHPRLQERPLEGSLPQSETDARIRINIKRRDNPSALTTAFGEFQQARG